MNDFPIVCVGGSAGGLDAYIRLLEKRPCDMGVAIVIVNHITITQAPASAKQPDMP
jgi:chemotaxis response regulator CheB